MKPESILVTGLALLVVLLCSIAGCGSPLSTDSTNNPDFKVEFMFEHDGCRVYRFEDWTTRYFVKCACGQASVEWQETCGEHCQRDVLVPTSTVPR